MWLGRAAGAGPSRPLVEGSSTAGVNAGGVPARGRGWEEGRRRPRRCRVGTRARGEDGGGFQQLELKGGHG